MIPNQWYAIRYYSGQSRCNALPSENQPSIQQTQPRIRVSKCVAPFR